MSTWLEKTPIASFAIWAALLIAILVRGYLMPQRNSVYPIFANAAREWTQGIDIYDKTVPRAELDRFRYAPIIAVGFTPLALLPDSLGGVLWRLCNTAVFLAGLFYFARAVFPGAANLHQNAVPVLGWLLFPMCVGNVNNGQPNILIAGCLLLAATATLRLRLNLAAFCLAVPVLIKVYPVSVAALFVLVQPRLGWRVVVWVALGCLLPFALQDPASITRAYASWITQVGSENRHLLTLDNTYRDVHALIRAAGPHLDERTYMILQLAMAGLVAAVVLRGHRLGWSTAHHLRAAFDLGCCWIILFGPATESATYALLAPTMALAVWEAMQDGQPAWKRWWAFITVALFVSTALIAMMGAGKMVSFVLLPLGGLLVFAERLGEYGRADLWYKKLNHEITKVESTKKEEYVAAPS